MECITYWRNGSAWCFGTMEFYDFPFQSMVNLWLIMVNKIIGITIYLVGGLEPWNFMTFHFIYGMSSFPTDEVHHFSEG